VSPRRGGRSITLLASLAAVVVAPRARAGGFEIPDNGPQAVGRGAAFVAKADDGTAIQYNPAGLAHQHGTRLFASGNYYFQSYEFQRSGTFADDPNDPLTPWGGKPYPAVTNSGGPYFAPFLALSSDFSTFDRLVVAAGVFGPPIVENRTFPLGIRGAPASSRYDFIQSRASILYPTFSAAYRVTPWLDLGVSGHLVVASFDQTMVSYVDRGQCKNAEYQPCDSQSTLTANATAVAGTFGAMARPDESLVLGLSVRTPVSLDADGTFSPGAPRASSLTVAPGAATYSTKLPLKAALGLRYVQMDRDFEVWDLEIDGVYEAWGSAQGSGARFRVPRAGQLEDIDALVVHRYKDTFGVRAGGAYNFEAGSGVLSTRLGGYFDSSATDFAYTRLDYDTLAKIAGTIGVGYKIGAFTLDGGYAAVASIPRVVGVGVGDVHPINIGKNGRTVDGADQLLPAVNSGAYRGFTHILSVGVTVALDAFFAEPRKVRFGNRWEPDYAPEDEAAPAPAPKKEPPPNVERGEEPNKKKKAWWEEGE
jgi:long-chain fatty acid transport protein